MSFSGSRWLTIPVVWALCCGAANWTGAGEVFLRASQVGYRAGEPKIAVAFARHVQIDFSALRQPGRFRLAVGQYRSIPFRAGDYATNEPTMDGTASAILMFALGGR